VARTIIIGVLVVVVAGYMIFDGVRELSGAGYIAPGGELGPWAGLLKRLGIDPHTPGVAMVFVGYGIALLGAFAYYLTGSFAGGIALIVVAVLGLWYLPFGTVGCLVVISLTLWDLITR
jgi:hypothetical protein